MATFVKQDFADRLKGGSMQLTSWFGGLFDNLKENPAPQQRQAPTKSATFLKPDFASRLHSYRDLHAHAMFSSLGRLLRTPIAFMITLLVLATSMALACLFYLLVQNFQQLTGNLEATNQISVYLKTGLSAEVINKAQQEIASNSSVESVRRITPEQALTELQANSGFGDVFNGLNENPLPVVLVILPKNSLEDAENIAGLVQTLQARPEVELAQSDMQWVQRIQSIVQLAKRSVGLISVLFCFAVLLMVGNTIRLELQNRVDEVVIAKLVGATNAFISRPFLYTGFWLGFLSSVVAWIIVTVIMLILQQPVQQLSQLYGSQFTLLFLNYRDTLGLLILGPLLGIFGSKWVLNNQLKNIKPE